MLLRIASILFPPFAIAALGYFIGRRQRPDLTHANRLNMDVFVPALVFAALAGKDFRLAEFVSLAVATLGLVVGCGLVGWPLARIAGIAPKTLVPLLMFNNSANLGIPVAVLTFGPDALAPAVVMFLVTNLLQFSFGAWLLDRDTRLATLWRIPSVWATLAGLAASMAGLAIWPPLVLAIRMVGDIAIPLMLFSLGVRLADSKIEALRAGLIGAASRPIVGVLVAFAMAQLMRLPAEQEAMLVVFGALPPAVASYIFAERYCQEPGKVASMVLLGNLAAVMTLPLVLSWVLAN